VAQKRARQSIRCQLREILYDVSLTNEKFHSEILKRIQASGSLQYLTRLHGDQTIDNIHITPKQMVDRFRALLKFFLNETSSELGDNNHGIMPLRPARPAGSLGHVFEKVANDVLLQFDSDHHTNKRHEKWRPEVKDVRRKLDTLENDMKNDNDFRDSCIRSWKDAGGVWIEETVE